MYMERGGLRSGEVLIKKRSSSGCLIVKKNDAVGKLSSFPETHSSFDRKRSRMIASDSESSDKLMIPHHQETPFGLKRDYVERKDDSFVGNSSVWKESSRHRLDDENEESEDEMLRRSYDVSGVDIGSKSYLGSAQFGIDMEYGTASSSKYLDTDKRRTPCLDNVGAKESVPHVLLLQKKYKHDLNFDRPIRVQGKNGVLKVMPKAMRGGLPQSFTHVEAQKPHQCGSKVQETGKIRVAIKTENLEKLLPPARIHSNGLTVSSPLTMKSKGQEQDSDGSDSSGQLQKRIIQPHKHLKIPSTTLPEPPTFPKTREGKVRRGSGTEKQRLRERIREMLLEAGWTIDYRPRRNRDYLDAVYISPRGTAYWSIIKAYEALLKQVNSGEQVAKPCEVGSAVTLISDEILSQLTRKTKRKNEEDMKRVEQCASDSDG